MFPEVPEACLSAWDHVEPPQVVPVPLNQILFGVVERLKVVGDLHHLMVDIGDLARRLLLSNFL